MKYIVSINDKNYEVEVERGEARIVGTTQAIHLDKAADAVPQVNQTAAPIPVSSPVPANAGNMAEGERIKAPMPGTILGVKVNPGAVVKRGDILFILEAMKMENEIVAPKDGTVVQLLTGKGSVVSTGEILAILK